MTLDDIQYRCQVLIERCDEYVTYFRPPERSVKALPYVIYDDLKLNVAELNKISNEYVFEDINSHGMYTIYSK